MDSIVTNTLLHADPELRRRDEASLEYERNRLTEGDTLIVVNLPNRASVYHPQGFRLDSQYRVESEKLKNTRSAFFNSMLSEEEQAKQRQLPAFSGRELPAGVLYVLDLSPSNENGEEILHMMSCPNGFCHWHSIGAQNGIGPKLIGGGEEFEFSGLYTPLLQRQEPYREAKLVDSDTENEDNEESKDVISSPPRINSNIERKRSSLEAPQVAIPPDYSLARHCACIERLLQLISGKNARLDSATKVWTVAMLASIYDCTSSVVDDILSWIFVSKNSSIIEIHPEAAFKLGLALRSPLLTRAAFSILVSEETMDIRPSIAPSQRTPTTMLGRIRDDSTIGEDQLNTIQKAALIFYENISQSIEFILNENMLWFTTCPEYRKLQAFRQRLQNDAAFKINSQYQPFLVTIDRLEESLQMFYRGHLLACQYRDPVLTFESETSHRSREIWSLQSLHDFDGAYSLLKTSQRWCTRQFWEQVRRYSVGTINSPSIWDTERKKLSQYGIRQVTEVEVHNLVLDFNLSVFGYETRHVSLPSTHGFPFSFSSSTATLKDKRERLTSQYYDAISIGENPSQSQYIAHELDVLDRKLKSPPLSTFFNVSDFSAQARIHLLNTCSAMLQRPVESETLGLRMAEGITCLNEEEWKFLPLWAGGCDDGSGGVGTEIPMPSNVTWGEMGIKSGSGASTIGESRLGCGGDTESVCSSAATNSHLDFGYSKFENLALRLHATPRFVGEASIGMSVSNDDSFSNLGLEAAMSEISFASSFRTSSEIASSSSASRQDPEVRNTLQEKALDDVMSDDFMLEDEDDEDFEDDEDCEDNDEDGFEVISEDEGEETETEA